MQRSSRAARAARRQQRFAPTREQTLKGASDERELEAALEKLVVSKGVDRKEVVQAATAAIIKKLTEETQARYDVPSHVTVLSQTCPSGTGPVSLSDVAINVMMRKDQVQAPTNFATYVIPNKEDLDAADADDDPEGEYKRRVAMCLPDNQIANFTQYADARRSEAKKKVFDDFIISMIDNGGQIVLDYEKLQEKSRKDLFDMLLERGLGSASRSSGLGVVRIDAKKLADGGLGEYIGDITAAAKGDAKAAVRALQGIEKSASVPFKAMPDFGADEVNAALSAPSVSGGGTSCEVAQRVLSHMFDESITGDVLRSIITNEDEDSAVVKSLLPLVIASSSKDAAVRRKTTPGPVDTATLLSGAHNLTAACMRLPVCQHLVAPAIDALRENVAIVRAFQTMDVTESLAMIRGKILNKAGDASPTLRNASQIVQLAVQGVCVALDKRVRESYKGAKWGKDDSDILSATLKSDTEADYGADIKVTPSTKVDKEPQAAFLTHILGCAVEEKDTLAELAEKKSQLKGVALGIVSMLTRVQSATASAADTKITSGTMNALYAAIILRSATTFIARRVGAFKAIESGDLDCFAMMRQMHLCLFTPIIVMARVGLYQYNVAVKNLFSDFEQASNHCADGKSKDEGVVKSSTCSLLLSLDSEHSADHTSGVTTVAILAARIQDGIKAVQTRAFLLSTIEGMFVGSFTGAEHAIEFGNRMRTVFNALQASAVARSKKIDSSAAQRMLASITNFVTAAIEDVLRKSSGQVLEADEMTLTVVEADIAPLAARLAPLAMQAALVNEGSAIYDTSKTENFLVNLGTEDAPDPTEVEVWATYLLDATKEGAVTAIVDALKVVVERGADPFASAFLRGLIMLNWWKLGSATDPIIQARRAAICKATNFALQVVIARNEVSGDKPATLKRVVDTLVSKGSTFTKWSGEVHAALTAQASQGGAIDVEALKVTDGQLTFGWVQDHFAALHPTTKIKTKISDSDSVKDEYALLSDAAQFKLVSQDTLTASTFNQLCLQYHEVSNPVTDTTPMCHWPDTMLQPVLYFIGDPRLSSLRDVQSRSISWMIIAARCGAASDQSSATVGRASGIPLPYVNEAFPGASVMKPNLRDIAQFRFAHQVPQIVQSVVKVISRWAAELGVSADVVSKLNMMASDTTDLPPSVSGSSVMAGMQWNSGSDTPGMLHDVDHIDAARNAIVSLCMPLFDFKNVDVLNKYLLQGVLRELSKELFDTAVFPSFEGSMEILFGSDYNAKVGK